MTPGDITFNQLVRFSANMAASHWWVLGKLLLIFIWVAIYWSWNWRYVLSGTHDYEKGFHALRRHQSLRTCAMVLLQGGEPLIFVIQWKYLIVLCYGKIVIPESLLKKMLAWSKGFEEIPPINISNGNDAVLLSVCQALSRFDKSWWRHQMETFSALLAPFCVGNSPGTGEFPSQRPSDADIWCFLWSAPE